MYPALLSGGRMDAKTRCIRWGNWRSDIWREGLIPVCDQQLAEALVGGTSHGWGILGFACGLHYVRPHVKVPCLFSHRLTYRLVGVCGAWSARGLLWATCSLRLP